MEHLRRSSCHYTRTTRYRNYLLVVFFTRDHLLAKKGHQGRERCSQAGICSSQATKAQDDWEAAWGVLAPLLRSTSIRVIKANNRPSSP
jgi:hypothetical protein